MSWAMVCARNGGLIRPTMCRRKRWPIASIARARPYAYVRLGLLPKSDSIGNLQRWDFGQVKAFIKAQNAATNEAHRLPEDEDAYLKGLKGGSAKKGER